MEGSTARGMRNSDDLVVRTIQLHADALLRLARRNSLCADDAADAYQRALEIFLHHADRLDPARAHSWLFTVVKREAWAIRDQRQQIVGSEEVDLDRMEARDAASPEDRVLAFESVRRSAEALQRLKPQEVRALWLKASGRSYAEIAEECGWTYTKVNRCITEGRRTFLRRCAEIESGGECERWAPVVSAMVDGEAAAADLAELRPHLRNCPACRAQVRALRAAAPSLGIVFPVALVVSTTGNGPETAAGMFVRVYEAFASGLHERATMSAIKAQAAVETMSAGKVAAVAASAAAIAGGGAVVVDDSHHQVHRPVAVRQHHTARAARPVQRPVLPVKKPPPAGARPNAPTPVATRSTSRPSPSSRRRAPTMASNQANAVREFGTPPLARAASASQPRAPTPPLASRPKPSASQRAAENEFNFEP